MRRGFAGAFALPAVVLACSSQPQIAASPSPISSPSALAAAAATLGAVGEMALTPAAVYALYAPSGTQGALEGAATTRLVRIDRASGAVQNVGPLPGSFHIAAAAGWVWVGSRSQVAIRRFNARNLAADQGFTPPRDLEKSPGVAPLVAASATDVWFASGQLLLRMNPDTGEVVRRQSTSGPVSSLVVDATGGTLYVGADASSGAGDAEVAEYDARTLQQTVWSPTGGGSLGGPHIAASAGDLWIAYATGMLGQVEHRRASTLTTIPVAARRFTNSIRVYAAARYIWASDGMAETLACLDPASGAVRATRAVKNGGVVVGDAAGLYLGDIDGVTVLNPDPGC